MVIFCVEQISKHMLAVGTTTYELILCIFQIFIKFSLENGITITFSETLSMYIVHTYEKKKNFRQGKKPTLNHSEAQPVLALIAAQYLMIIHNFIKLQQHATNFYLNPVFNCFTSSTLRIFLKTLGKLFTNSRQTETDAQPTIYTVFQEILYPFSFTLRTYR